MERMVRILVVPLIMFCAVMAIGDVVFHHVFELSDDGEELDTGYGRFSITYTPEPDGVFINVLASIGFEPVWIVRNLYLPDRSWIADDQTITKRFPLSLFLSLPSKEGFDFDYIIYRVMESPTMISSPPDIELTDEAMPLRLIDDTRVGVFYDEDIDPPLDELEFFPDFVEGSEMDEVEFRGCRVPNIDLDSTNHPASEEYAGDKNACGVASTANSFMWMKDVYDEVDFDLSHRELLEMLSGLMEREPNSGVSTRQIVKAKLDLIEELGLDIKVKFQCEFNDEDIHSSSMTTIGECQNSGEYPTWEWLKNEIQDGEDVELNFRWENSRREPRGHSVVVTGIEESEDGIRRVKFKHDIRQSTESNEDELEHADEEVYIDEYGRLRMPARRNALISSVISESPGAPFLNINNESAQMPSVLELKAFPNPFNAVVRLSLELPHSGNVAITVYDVFGRVVGNIYSGYKEKGRHTFNWDALDLPNDIYLVRCTTGDTALVLRLVLIK